MKSRYKELFPERRSFRLVLLFGFFLFVGLYGTYRLHSIRPVLKKIHPGMSYKEVRDLTPARFVKSEQKVASSSFHFGTYVEIGKTNPAYYVYITSKNSFFHPAEIAEIYFDSNDRVIAIDYSSDSWSWHPSWGIKLNVTD